MTASSVELFPCRVQLMGLPRSTTSASSAASGSSSLGNLSVGLNRQPPIQKLRRVSRNLFGSPDPIEMKNLYLQEAERQRKYVLGRYNIDTKSLADASEDNSSEITTKDFNNYANSSFKPPTALPTLIEQELKQHDQHRQSEKKISCQTSLEETPSNTKICNHANRIPEVTRRCCEHIATLSPAVDHQKPYTRQSLLTERFNIRKNRVCLSRSPKGYNAGVSSSDRVEATANAAIPLPLKGKTCNTKHEEDTKPVCQTICVENDKDNNSALVFKNKHKALSLELVVSTQNIS